MVKPQSSTKKKTKKNNLVVTIESVLSFARTKQVAKAAVQQAAVQTKYIVGSRTRATAADCTSKRCAPFSSTQKITAYVQERRRRAQTVAANQPPTRTVVRRVSTNKLPRRQHHSYRRLTKSTTVFSPNKSLIPFNARHLRATNALFLPNPCFQRTVPGAVY